jgi:hypothetical protein
MSLRESRDGGEREVSNWNYLKYFSLEGTEEVP